MLCACVCLCVCCLWGIKTASVHCPYIIITMHVYGAAKAKFDASERFFWPSRNKIVSHSAHRTPGFPRKEGLLLFYKIKNSTSVLGLHNDLHIIINHETCSLKSYWSNCTIIALACKDAAPQIASQYSVEHN